MLGRTVSCTTAMRDQGPPRAHVAVPPNLRRIRYEQ